MPKAEKPATVKVTLTCIYSGADSPPPGPGDVIEVDAAEAERLVSLGAAQPVGVK